MTVDAKHGATLGVKRLSAPHVARAALYFCTLVHILLLAQACTSIRPVAKIGLLAPFEGLYRRTGYVALHAMRTALAEAPQGAVDVLPLALDDANDPVQAQRAAQKLAVDPNVRAMIGPLLPGVLPSVLPVLESGVPLWLVPFVMDEGGFTNPRSPMLGFEPLVTAVAEAAQSQGCMQLVLAGWPDLPITGWTTDSVLPIVQHESPVAVQSTDAVLYLGDPDQAADYLISLRARQPDVPFFLGPQGEDPVFAEHAQISGPVYWATWLDEAYDGWAAQHGVASPAAYHVYRATQQILTQLTGAQPSSPGMWQLRFFVVDAQGQSRASGWP